jgi:hypothetical protein
MDQLASGPARSVGVESSAVIDQPYKTSVNTKLALQ